MKKLYLLWSILGLFAGGCTSALDVTPENSVTFENFFKTEEDLEINLNAVKNAFRVYCGLGNTGNLQMCKGIIMDKYSGVGLGWKANLAKKLDATLVHTPRAVSCSWKKFYHVISQAQVTKEYADRADLPQEKIDYYKGQASFYEAYTYFIIAQDWGDAVIVKNSRDVGARGRSSWQEVVQFSLDRVNDAIAWLPTYQELKKKNGTPETSRDIVCKEIAYTLKAFMCAWKASLNNEPKLFEDAIAAATEVIKNKSCYNLAGTPEEVCTSVLIGKNMTEAIFEIPMIGYWNEIFTTDFSTVEGYLTFPIKPEEEAGDILFTNARIYYTTVDKMYPKDDLRREAYFYELDARKDDIAAGGFAYPYKYRLVRTGSQGDNIGKYTNLNQNHIIYRLADLILLRAECYARLNQTTPAINDLNQIRNRANAPAYPSIHDTGDLRYAIFKEREKELLWEDQRYYDIVRNGYWKTEISSAYSNLSSKDIENGALYLPVGQDAFNQNPMMKQNKYWLSRW